MSTLESLSSIKESYLNAKAAYEAAVAFKKTRSRETGDGLDYEVEHQPIPALLRAMKFWEDMYNQALHGDVTVHKTTLTC